MRHYRAFTHLSAARTAVMEHIELGYNRRRTHTSNGGVGPLARLERYRVAQVPVLAA
ncbi:hypothetical protein GCM10009715_34030 [Paeniglutamicibacter psychrophenolicus]|uniref:Transposase n=1 Tax=Paeniglutamicibacter psychrophenolicus TaxID=257454 RepID=A0ABS4W9W9_9MICC|nr:hypothetical protein [Paeniglutamicibacter psychrophenolicus]